jgi:putative FmdB family regulatory protein
VPTYEYACDNCGHEFDKFQAITARPLKKCPVCGKNKLRRLIGAGGGVIFKGSGFYQTDYRSPSYEKAVKAEKSAQSATKGDGDSKRASGKKAESGSSTTKVTESAGESSAKQNPVAPDLRVRRGAE